jgi:uncharacterized protein YegL
MNNHPILNKKSYIIYLFCFLIGLAPSGISKAQRPNQLHSILFLLDVSGSMKGTKIDSVKSATKKIIQMLLPCNTEFAIMAYSGKPDHPIHDQMNFTTNKDSLLTFVDGLKAEGETPLGAALKTACFYFKNNKNRASVRQTIILLGDGRSDDNITLALKDTKQKKSLIQCECVGFDIQYDNQAEQQLRQIASETGGEYYTANTVSNVIAAFLKSSIKTILGNVPVVVRKSPGTLNFPATIPSNSGKMMTKQSWIVDSIQINVSPDLFLVSSLITNENMQDTLPKSIVFDNSKRISFFINKGATADANKKWMEGDYHFYKNALTIHIQKHYLKLILKRIEEHNMVLCVNEYKDLENDMVETNDEICDCENKMAEGNPYILVYFSQAGCNY